MHKREPIFRRWFDEQLILASCKQSIAFGVHF